MKKILFWISLILSIVVGILGIIFIVLSGEGMVPMGWGIGFTIAFIILSIIQLCLYWSTYAFDFLK